MTRRNIHRAAILLGSAAFVALAVPAQARPSHHHRHYHHAATRTVGVTPAQAVGADRDDRYAATSAQRSSAVAAQSYAAAATAGEPVAGEATQSRRWRAAQSHSNSAFGG